MEVERRGVGLAIGPGPESTIDVEPAGVATPFESIDEAVEVVLGWLAANGHGRWRLGNVSLQELDPPSPGLLPIAAPGSSRLVALRCEEPPALDREAPAVTFAGRLIATLLSSAHTQDRLAERLAAAERESAIEPLTGLPNARAWWRQLSREAARCDRHGLTAGVLVVDLDELKETNDTAGHLAGDMLLRQAADTLSAGVRRGDFVARVGGDEFAVLATDLVPDALDALVDKVTAMLAADSVEASIGAALYSPGARVNDVYHEADQAMYRAKRMRRGPA